MDVAYVESADERLACSFDRTNVRAWEMAQSEYAECKNGHRWQWIHFRGDTQSGGHWSQVQ